MYEHTIDVIQRATLLGGYRALPARDIFDVEYWDLEQAKLRKAGAAPQFAGEIALVTGAASGIGKACVEALHARGAAVVGLDIDPASRSFMRAPGLSRCPLRRHDAPGGGRRFGFRRCARFGGLDMLVLNAGIFPAGTAIAALDDASWRSVMSINLDANLIADARGHPLLKLAPRGGRVSVIGSKNVPAPGPGAAAYSASKAALTQLARVAALEWGADGIRVNVAASERGIRHRRSGREDVSAARAAQYGLTVEQYKTQQCIEDGGHQPRRCASSRPRCAARCSPRPPARRFPSTAATSASSDGRISVEVRYPALARRGSGNDRPARVAR